MKGLRSFKPCYKWNAFNTIKEKDSDSISLVLNLVINGMPSIQLAALQTIIF